MSKAKRVRKLGGITLRPIGQIARLQTIQDNDEDYRRQRGGGTYFAATIAGGFQVPSPGGRIDGASVFGQ